MTLFEEVLAALNNHREKSTITCGEHCFCWEIDQLLLKAEVSQEFEVVCENGDCADHYGDPAAWCARCKRASEINV